MSGSLFLRHSVYTTLFTTNGRKQNEKRQKKREENNMYRIEKKLDYDLTNIHSLANNENYITLSNDRDDANFGSIRDIVFFSR